MIGHNQALMAKKAAAAAQATVKSLKAKIKWKASDLSGSVQYRHGIREGRGPGVSSAIPTGSKGRVLETENYVYLSIPATVELFKKDGKTLVPLADDEPVSEELQKEMDAVLKVAKKATAKRAAAPELPADVLRKLSDSIPAGFKLAIKNGEVTLVKARTKKA